MRNLLLLIAASLVSTGCHLGKNAADLPVAHQVTGATVQVTTSSQRFDGHLLEVRDNGIVVWKNNGPIALVPWLVTRKVSTIGFGREYSYGLLMPPGRAVIANLVKVSQFPQGMTADIEARLLASRGQKELVVVQ